MRLQLKLWQIVALVLFSAACTAGAGAGMSAVLGVAAICTAVLVVACSSPPPKNNNQGDVGPCLSPLPHDFGPCLSIVPDLGPCLSPPLPDMEIGPCLGALPPDMGEDMPGDMGIFGPCLSIAPDFGNDDTGNEADLVGQSQGLHETRPTHRQELLAKLSDRLPEDVASRLANNSRDKKPS